MAYCRNRSAADGIMNSSAMASVSMNNGPGGIHANDVNEFPGLFSDNDDGLFQDLELLHMLQANVQPMGIPMLGVQGNASPQFATEAPVPNDTPTESPTPFPPPANFGANGAPPPKIGSRFSRDAVRVLRNWLTNHSQHPFASEDEKDLLQRQTGLSKTQISNWLANARRRGKTQNVVALTKAQNTSTGSIDIPRRSATPAYDMKSQLVDPLQRWVDSPPEYEPASASAIARAMADCSDSPGTRSPFNFHHSNDGSNTPYSRASSASSRGTSMSSGGSVYSFESRDGAGPLKALSSAHQRRKKRAAQKQMHAKTSLLTPLNTFQCTFCTETFRTKHNWQRHEKSLHLALETWVCAPNGPREMDDDQILRCVFCGGAEPDDAHLKTHNYLDCRGRLPEERTFTRKDHLGQHLRLVHNVKPKDLDGPLAQWKMPAPEIRSRCGFCGVALDTWKARVDHLADHFKAGNTMADWKGNWGFDDHVLARLESSIPPYFIATERNTPFPFEASNPLSESPCNAYELIEVELMHFVQVDFERSKKLPTSDELQLEACRIVFASEVLSENEGPGSSWLRDLIMSSEAIERQARFSSMRSNAESRLPLLKIMGQDTLFEACPLEAQLRAFSGVDQSIPLTDQELQQEASRIIRRIEDQSRCPAEFIANWLIELAGSSTGWLTGFRMRAQIPYREASMEPSQLPANSSKIDSILNNYSELERRLSEYVDTLQAHGIEVDDMRLQRQAQSIIDEFDDEEWKNVASSNESWLMSFKRRYTSGRSTKPTRNFAHLTSPPIGKLLSKSAQTAQSLEQTPDQSPLNTSDSTRNPAMVQSPVKYGHLNTHHTNFHRWVAVELARWVASTMSPNNPNQHIPTDEELQHQARFIFYDDDDPWNQTPADNEEWLKQFKLDVGIFKEPSINNTA